MSPRVVIAGGYGLVGGLVARHLRAAGHELDLVLAGRNPGQGASLAAELGALTKGRVHGSAIAIFLGLVLAYIGGEMTGGSKGIADAQRLRQRCV